MKSARSLKSHKKEFPLAEAIPRTRDYVIASRSLRVKLKHMEVVDDFASTPHKAVTFQVQREKKREGDPGGARLFQNSQSLARIQFGVRWQVEVKQKVGNKKVTRRMKGDGWERM